MSGNRIRLDISMKHSLSITVYNDTVLGVLFQKPTQKQTTGTEYFPNIFVVQEIQLI